MNITKAFIPIDFEIPSGPVSCFDTETTGLDPATGDRLVSIGVVELNGETTIHEQQWIIDPERHIPDGKGGAARIHGITDLLVQGAPKFRDIAPELMGRLAGRHLVIHNADFDLGFMAMELARLGLPPLANPVIDTLVLARRARTSSNTRANLDAAAEGLGVAKGTRGEHGALKDAKLLAKVFLAFRRNALQLRAARDFVGTARGIMADRHLAMPNREEIAAHNIIMAKLRPSLAPAPF